MDRAEVREYFNQTSISIDLYEMVIGAFIGSGVYRSVFVYEPDPTCVIKIETSDAKRFCNVQEWEVWQGVKDDKKISSWFAPCISISPCGNFLVQKRTRLVTLDELKKKLPRVPRFFKDRKVGNWGKIDERIVCHDYGNNSLMYDGMKYVLKNAKWWE